MQSNSSPMEGLLFFRENKKKKNKPLDWLILQSD